MWRWAAGTLKTVSGRAKTLVSRVLAVAPGFGTTGSVDQGQPLTEDDGADMNLPEKSRSWGQKGINVSRGIRHLAAVFLLEATVLASVGHSWGGIFWWKGHM